MFDNHLHTTKIGRDRCLDGREIEDYFAQSIAGSADLENNLSGIGQERG
jgi:hypothetical protein